ncbi:MAG: 3-dehydroquinate synthase [Pyrinomonadaceae bacterium]
MEIERKELQRVEVRLREQERSYQIIIGAGTLDALGIEARRCLDKRARRIAIISNRKVFDLYGARANRSLLDEGFAVEHWLMGEGERHKSMRTLESALGFLGDSGLERSDAVVALGGGVVGDLAGFASAVYLRGISLLQVPTTLLAQIDASVGGKVAVNTAAGKNLVGAFHQPRAVLIDTSTLRTLPQRELTAGWCEAVKQGAAGDRKLFKQTVQFLEAGKAIQSKAGPRGSSSGDSSEADYRSEHLARLIAAQCTFKAKIVAGDERESITRMDARSRRILNFGHTTAHALEAVTRYRRFRHGEAVGYGMMVAAEISKKLGLLDVSELESLRHAVASCGRLPRADDLDEAAITEALAHDKKSVGGHIKWVLLERIGRAAIVDGKEISPRLLRASLRAALSSTS